ncbi:LIC_12708 family protein [Treponema sp.]|uniref:LIC_12708 family protein n=1 Tax=Treponema sp. TaxID=166 RepID=UPI003890FCEE
MKIKFKIFVLTVCAVCFLSSCVKSNQLNSVNENKLFTLDYGNFENELNLFDLAKKGNIRTYMTMRDGFFYIANGESKKILEFNSYGDLLSLYYNDEVLKDVAFAGKNSTNSTKKAVSYPFNTLGPIAIDSRKYIYAIDTLPVERQERDISNRLLLSSVVLRFDSSGKFIDYIGQEGPGGTPFPFVKNVYTTRENELVVICTSNDGLTAYWFNTNGFLLYTVPVSKENVPKIQRDESSDVPYYVSITNIVPDCSEHKLYVNVDYYAASLDSQLKVQSGIDYYTTLLCPLNVETGFYDEPLEIPSYEYALTENLTKEIYNLPYDFLGVTENGWFFFIVPNEEGFIVQMVQPDGQRIVKRSLSVDHSKILYYTLSLSGKGIISALFVKNENAETVWWRTDSLLASFVNQ